MKADEITSAVERLVSTIAPASVKRKMYGGIVFEAEPGDAGSRFGGYFVYAKHVGFEFTQGARLNDPDQILEGKGKLRRHIKLATASDIETKELDGFIRQAVTIGTEGKDTPS